MAPPRPLRLGVVPYMNVLPLLEGLDRAFPRANWIYDTPRELARMLDAGRVDVGILSIYEAMRRSELKLVRGCALGCDGPVRSVQLFSLRPLTEISRVLLDRSSLTSINLVRILLPELLGVFPFYQLSDAPLHPSFDLRASGFDAAVVIGDTALAWERLFEHHLDLGEGWKRLTGMPFVFAAWVLREGLVLEPEESLAFLEARIAGQSAVDRIARAEAARLQRDPEDLRHYLSQAMRYELGTAQEESIREFRRRLDAHGLL